MKKEKSRIEAGPKTKAKGLPPRDVMALLRIADKPEDRLLLILMWAAAMSLTRLRELRVRDVDFESEQIQIRSGHWVPLSKSASRWIGNYLVSTGKTQNNLLLSDSKVTPARPAFERKVQRTLSSLGIRALKRRVSAFEIRTGRIRDLVSRGMSPRSLVHLLGIDDPRTVGQYCLAYYSPDDSEDERKNRDKKIRDHVEIDLPDSPQVDSEVAPHDQLLSASGSRRKKK